MTIFDDLRNLSPERFESLVARLTDKELALLLAELDPDSAHRFGKYRRKPAEFVTEVLGETVWSKQREVLEALAVHDRVVVPASHSVSKTHTAARVAAWWVSVYEPGTSLVITTAPTFRQVRNVLWPHIRRLHARHNLPGETNLTEWKVDNELVAFGFSAADNNEAAVQGYHMPNMLAIVDEAGGIGHTLGNALEGIMTGGNTKMLLIGNPPTDEEQSWFEKCVDDPAFHAVRVSALDSPNITGEKVGDCKACPENVPAHSLATHLVDQAWIDRQVRMFGEDSAFVQARVYARFVKGSADKVIPWAWIEQAQQVEVSQPVEMTRIGVDVAADGGDELAIAVWDSEGVKIVHTSAGSANASQVTVAGRVWEIAQRYPRSRIKIDAVGIGRGTSDLLQQWSREKGGGVEVVPVNVAKKPSDVMWKNQRAELWWNGREMFREAGVKLGVDDITLAQLAAPKFGHDSSGRIVIESKQDIKRRGLNSPDRAEAVLLALFEPPGSVKSIPVPLGIGQSNVWRM